MTRGCHVSVMSHVFLSQKNIHKETGLGLQLQKILENFVSNQWENLNNSYVAKECLWKPRSKSLALSDFCSDHARIEAKEEDTRESGFLFLLFFFLAQRNKTRIQ